MKAEKLIEQRFSELAKKAEDIAANPIRYQTGDVGINDEKFQAWATSVLSVLQRVFDEDSPYYRNFLDYYKQYRGDESDFVHCKGIFQAAKEDYEAGYLFTVRGLIKAEDSSDILDQATEILKAGYKDPACVIAGVALEIALKELCTRNGIAHAKLDAMNAELCKKGIYNTGMQKQITTWAHWRNKAAHGEWNEYKDVDVEDMIKGATRFIADYL